MATNSRPGELEERYVVKNILTTPGAEQRRERITADRYSTIQHRGLLFGLAALALTAACSTSHAARVAAPLSVSVVPAATTAPLPEPPAASLTPDRQAAQSFPLAPPSGSQPESAPIANAGAVRFPAGFPGLIKKDVQHIATAPLRWGRGEWTKFGIGVVAIGGALLLDNELRQSVDGNSNSSTQRLADAVQPFGEEYSWGTLAGFYLAGKAFHDDKAMSVAQDGLASSLIAAGVITPFLKVAISRQRPQETEARFVRGANGRSFPSGHTTQAFVIASVVASHYPSPWVQVGAYGLAGLVGWSRMEHGAHYASDVLAGALIGTVVGRTVVGLHEKERIRISAAPSVNPASPGVALTAGADLDDVLALFRHE
jgi:membrane-associated phospholipid phosphatase